MKNMTYYRFIFEDGYFCIVRGLSASERKHMELKHGKLVDKIREA